jgi:hypothetical protein
MLKTDMVERPTTKEILRLISEDHTVFCEECVSDIGADLAEDFAARGGS